MERKCFCGLVFLKALACVLICFEGRGKKDLLSGAVRQKILGNLLLRARLGHFFLSREFICFNG